MSTLLELVKDVLASVDKTTSMLTDEQASRVVQLYRPLKGDGSLVRAGTRIKWKGQLKRAANDLWDTVQNNPDNAPTLWENINYRDGYRVIPNTITVGLAFKKGEIGWWKEQLYRSIYDGENIWTPEQYADGWEVYEA